MILENITKAIKKSGKSRYQISKETGIDEAVLCRIVTGSGTGSCSTKTADILCRYLGLELVAKKSKKRGK
jgi:ribosome-binding protein aMBF1 (putative translation factor)